MPLYMDFHQFDSITVEDVKKAHMADVAVQEKYGVRYLQFWVNEEAGAVFCLTEGPDPESCEACHQEAHGNIPCNIQEVEPGFFKLFMGEGLPDDYGMALAKDGKADPANRTLLVCDICGITTAKNLKEYKQLLIATKPKNLVVDSVKKFNGQFIEHSIDDHLISVFDSSINAMRCAGSVREHLLRHTKQHVGDSEWNVAFKLAINKGQPITEREGFFEAAITQAKRMCMIAVPNQITLSANLRNLYEMKEDALSYGENLTAIKVLSEPEENFINELFDITEQNLRQDTFNVSRLCKMIGLSRPQLYRKTTSLTGKSPNDFIKDLRMKKAWKLLKSKSGNISEVAFEVGYSSPSYFSKVFNESFGYNPSALHSIVK